MLVLSITKFCCLVKIWHLLKTAGPGFLASPIRPPCIIHKINSSIHEGPKIFEEVVLVIGLGLLLEVLVVAERFIGLGLVLDTSLPSALSFPLLWYCKVFDVGVLVDGLGLFLEVYGVAGRFIGLVLGLGIACVVLLVDQPTSITISSRSS